MSLSGARTMEIPVVATSELDLATLTEATLRSGSLRSSLRFSRMFDISLRAFTGCDAKGMVHARGGELPSVQALGRPALVTSSRFSTTILLFDSEELLKVGAATAGAVGGLF